MQMHKKTFPIQSKSFMNQRMRKLGKKPAAILCKPQIWLLAGLLLATCALGVTLPASASSDNPLSSYPIMNLTEPEGFASTDQPLGTDTETPVLLVEEAELLRFYSYDNNKDKGASAINMYDTLTLQTGSVESGASSTSTVDLKSSQTGVYGLNNVQAVSFDPSGSGRRDHVAFVGLDSSNNVKIVVYDTTLDKWSSKINLGSMDRFVQDGTNYYAMESLLSITAGDYNKDNKDTIVVYAPIDGNQNYLQEISVTSTNYSISLNVIKQANGFVQPSYADTDLGYSSEKNGRDVLRGEVRTGDFDGDGIDDLAVLTQLGKCKKYEDGKYSYSMFAPYLCTATGVENSSSILSQAAKESSISKYQRTDEDGNQYLDTLYGASMAIGDYDQNGYDSIVIVGRDLTIRDNKGNQKSDDWSFNTDYVSFAKVYVSDMADHQMVFVSGKSASLAAPWLTKKKSARTNIDDSSSVGVSAVRFDGVGTAAYLVVDGAVYTWNGAEWPSQLESFSSREIWGDTGDNAFVSSYAVGNFTAGEEGYEQVVFTLAIKNDSLQDDYDFKNVMIYASEHDATTGQASAFECTRSPEKYVDDKGDNRNEGVNGLVVAIDNDDDGVIVKYESKACYYTDPELLTVLQAAPYYDELYRNDAANLQNGGDTRLTLSEKHGTAYGKEKSQELEAGMDMQFGGTFYPVTANLKGGYHGSWTSGWEDSMSYEVSETFSASTCDQVIVYRTPVYCYNYKVYNQETKQYDGQTTYYVKQKPTYVQMSLDDYERFCVDYNETMAAMKVDWIAKNPGKKLDYAQLYSLSGLTMLGNEGDPFAYTYGGIPYGSVMSLGTAGGSSGISYQVTSEYTEYTQHADGGYVGADIMTGFLVIPFNIGLEGHFSFDWSDTQKQVTGQGISFNGSVGNLVYTTFTSENYGKETYDAYGFDWQFCTYNTSIPSQTLSIGDVTYDTLQILGYHTNNLKSPPSPPEITWSKYTTTVEYDYFDLRWENSDVSGNRPNPVEYRIYSLESGEYKLIAKVDSDTTSYEFRDFVAGKTEYTLCVQAKDANGNLSVMSEAVYCSTSGGTGLVKATYRGIVKTGSDTRYAYDIYYNDGSQYPFYLVSNGVTGGVSKTRETYNQLVSEGLMPEKITDWNAWTSTIDDVHNLNGCLDSGEASYTWKLDECSEIRTTACAICSTPMVERHELRAHDFTETVVYGSCEEQGYTIYTCKNCGFEKHDDFTGYCHEYQQVEVPATCCSAACTMAICTDCGETHVVSYSEDGPDLTKHSYVETTPITKAGDTDNDGKTDKFVQVSRKVCKYCGDVVEEQTADLTETYELTAIVDWDENNRPVFQASVHAVNCEYFEGKGITYTEQELYGSNRVWTDLKNCYPKVSTTDWKLTDITCDVEYFETPTAIGAIGRVVITGYLGYGKYTCASSKSQAVFNIYDHGNNAYALNQSTGSKDTYITSEYGTIYDQDQRLAFWFAAQLCSSDNQPSARTQQHAGCKTYFDMEALQNITGCMFCTNLDYESVSHTHEFTSTQVAKTVGGAGGHVFKTCSTCGYSEITSEGYDQQKAESECKHTFVELGHSCMDENHVWRICTTCKKMERIEKSLAEGEEACHHYITEVVEPTCTEGGYTVDTCAKCGKTVVHDEVAPLGHSAVEKLDVHVAATCQHGGYVEHTCERCGEVYQDSFEEQLEHTYVDEGLVTIPATCCSGEYTINHCTYCNQTIQVGSIGEPAKDAHEYDKETHPLTCTTKGCFTYTCRHCGDTYSVYFEDDPETGVTEAQNTPAGHVEDTSVTPEVVAPTASEPGYTLRRCAVCGEHYQTDPTEPTGEVRESKTYCGSGLPSTSLGLDGDIYIDVQTGKIYLKTNGTWDILGGTQEDPEINIIVSQGHTVFLSFETSVSAEDQELIRANIDKVNVTGITDQLRYEGQKYILAAAFPDIWEDVSMDNFLKDPTNKVTMRVRISINVVSADFSDPNNPYIEYSFSPEVIVNIESPSVGNQHAEYDLSPDDFKGFDISGITVTMPVCGTFDVTHVLHLDAETGELIEVFFGSNAPAVFIYDPQTNTVKVTVQHFSNFIVRGGSYNEQGGRILPQAGDSADKTIAVLVAAAIGGAIVLTVASKRKVKKQ